MPRLLIAASGTGGHLFPALAVADAMPAGWGVQWLGVPDRLETQLVPSRYPLHTVRAGGLQGRGLRKLLNLLQLLQATAAERDDFRRRIDADPRRIERVRTLPRRVGLSGELLRLVHLRPGPAAGLLLELREAFPDLIGKDGDELRITPDPRREALLTTEDSRRIGLFDMIVNNTDRTDRQSQDFERWKDLFGASDSGCWPAKSLTQAIATNSGQRKALHVSR